MSWLDRDQFKYGQVVLPDDTNRPMPAPEGEGGFSLAQLQEAVGGYIERVRDHRWRSRGMELIVNEEGIPKGLPVNEIGSMLAQQVIHGPLVIIPKEYWS